MQAKFGVATVQHLIGEGSWLLLNALLRLGLLFPWAATRTDPRESHRDVIKDTDVQLLAFFGTRSMIGNHRQPPSVADDGLLSKQNVGREGAIKQVRLKVSRRSAERRREKASRTMTNEHRKGWLAPAASPRWIRYEKRRAPCQCLDSNLTGRRRARVASKFEMASSSGRN